MYICHSEDAGQAAATETKALILKSALPFVPQYGWTKQSLALGMIYFLIAFKFCFLCFAVKLAICR
jgi:hypothetical protein